MQKRVQDLFKEKKVTLVVGYGKGSIPLRSRPCLIKSEDEASGLVWNSFCINNCAVYLKDLFRPSHRSRVNKSNMPRVGIIAKGCDARSVAGLIAENQVPADNVTIIAMPCHGMVSREKINNLLNGDSALVCLKDEYEFLEIKTRTGKIHKIYKQDILTDACRECRYPVYEGADIRIKGEAKEISPSIDIKVNKFELLIREERLEFFQKELSKCIRCYACRQACPNCFCTLCFSDQTKPRWIGLTNDISNIMMFHIGRIFHQAGRCVGCDACVQACPMGIDLRTFTQKMVKDVEELYGYIPGVSMNEDLPLCTFDNSDSQEFITEP
jgi:ferredoxin